MDQPLQPVHENDHVLHENVPHESFVLVILVMYLVVVSVIVHLNSIIRFPPHRGLAVSHAKIGRGRGGRGVT